MMNNAIFVFGSNTAGIHGRGAARYAALKYGAVQGVGRGQRGRSYALPTKDDSLRTLPLAKIEENIREFVLHARENHWEVFHLTPIGCGLAGYSRADIWAILHRVKLPSNVVLSPEWVNDHP